MNATRPARQVWHLDDIRQLGVTTSLTTAAQILGICYPTARRLAASGMFPVPVIRLSRRWKVPTEPLIALLTTGRVRDRTTVAQEQHGPLDTTKRG